MQPVKRVASRHRLIFRKKDIGNPWIWIVVLISSQARLFQPARSQSAEKLLGLNGRAKTNTTADTESIKPRFVSAFLRACREVRLHVCLCGASICLTLRWERPPTENNNSQDSWLPANCTTEKRLRAVRRLSWGGYLDVGWEGKRQGDMKRAEQWKERDRNKDKQQRVKCSFPPQGKQPGKIIVERRQRKATNDSRQ